MKKQLKLLIFSFLIFSFFVNVSNVLAKEENILVEEDNIEEMNGFVEDQATGNLRYYENGELVHGFKEIDGSLYYFDLDTGFMKTGWLNQGEEFYYFSEDGKALRDGFYEVPVLSKDLTIKEYNWKYFNEAGLNESKIYESGADVKLSIKGMYSSYYKGWWTNPSDKRTYFFSNISASMTKGLLEIADDFYFFNPDDGHMEIGWQLIDNFWYYFSDSGKMYISTWKWLPVYNEDGGIKGYNWKYFNEVGRNTDQFYHENGMTWLSLSGPYSTYHKGFWTDPSNGYTFYFRESSGTRVDKWQYIEGSWYYFRANSGSLTKGWQYIDDFWYFMEEDGKRIEDSWKWIKLNNGKGNWKYFNPVGRNVSQFYHENNMTWLSQAGPDKEYYKGWWKNSSNGLVYFFRMTSGTRVEDFQYIDGNWYFFRKGSGSMASGFQYINGDWYFFRKGSGSMASGFQYIDGDWYYFLENTDRAKLLRNQHLDKDGKSYWLDSNGKRSLVFLNSFRVSNGRFYRYNERGILVDTQYVGNRFVVVDLGQQRLFMYDNGKEYVRTNVITGKPSTPTITGHFHIYSKERNRYLKGRWFVNYWLPFIGGYGIHDAYWQSQAAYNDRNAFQYRGSHGCVNTPLNAVEKVFSRIRVGDSVIVFN